MAAPNAVELTADAAWLVAETIGAGTFPWVLAITPAVADEREAPPAVRTRLRSELTRARVMSDAGTVNPAVARWTRTVCAPQRWLELRYVRAAGTELLRGLVARRGDETVAALRSGELVTFTELDISEPFQLAPPVVAAGLTGRAPARFTEFSLPTRVGGVRADEKSSAWELISMACWTTWASPPRQSQWCDRCSADHTVMSRCAPDAPAMACTASARSVSASSMPTPAGYW